MKKLFLVLCVVVMFFGIVGCPSSDNATPQAFKSAISGTSGTTVTPADGGEIAPPAVPEPATLILLGAGLVGLAGIGRKKFFK